VRNKVSRIIISSINYFDIYMKYVLSTFVWLPRRPYFAHPYFI